MLPEKILEKVKHLHDQSEDFEKPFEANLNWLDINDNRSLVKDGLRSSNKTDIQTQYAAVILTSF